MGNPMSLLAQEPVAAQGLAMALINLLIAFQIVTLTDAQIGAINIFLAALFAFLVRRSVTPLSNPRNSAGQPLVTSPVAKSTQSPVTGAS